jgi:hypothetical protein
MGAGKGRRGINGSRRKGREKEKRTTPNPRRSVRSEFSLRGLSYRHNKFDLDVQEFRHECSRTFTNEFAEKQIGSIFRRTTIRVHS